MTKLIVGLGNPGRKYQQTRHNVGFVVAARLADRLAAGKPKLRFQGELAESSLAGHKLIILCPQTFMNASGQSVRKAVDFYQLPPSDLLVISDDLNLPTGRLRLRPQGSAGGQKGLADIIRQLGTDEFARLRIGIDRPPEHWSITDYVLGAFGTAELDKINPAIERATEAALCWASEGPTVAMSRYNAGPDRQQSDRQQSGGPQHHTPQRPAKPAEPPSKPND